MAGEFASLNVTPEGVAILRMQDEQGRNALSEGMVHALEALLDAVANRDDVKVMIVAGLPEYFSSGASREVLLKLSESKIEPGDLLLPRRFLSIPIPTIAAMEGHALGGGLALGICCDIVMIARESRYGCPFMNFGFTPGMGTTRLLEHVVSPAIAHEMLFTGRSFKGSHFEGRSAFNDIGPRADLWRKAMDSAERIAEKPRSALVLLKEHLASARIRVYEEALRAEAAMHRKTFTEGDVVRRIIDNS